MTKEAKGSVEPKKRRRGRPRKDEADREVRRAEIINAAVTLFVERSYRETTMSDIAHAIGLNQSSLYYWFKDKEELLEAILKDNTKSLELASMLAMLPGNHPLHLYSIVYADTLMMCSYPFDYFELEDVALSHPDRFKAFFETYRDLRNTIERVIADGLEAGDFPKRVDPSLATNIVLSMAEGMQHQYHQSITDDSDLLTSVWGSVVDQSVEGIAKLVADSAINAIAGDIDGDALYQAAVEKGWISADSQQGEDS